MSARGEFGAESRARQLHPRFAIAASKAAVALRALAWFLNGVLGADAYRHYLEHHRATGCSSVPMTEREFWRDKHDRQDRQPEGRCC